jgi:hypothetical protein
MTTKQPTPQELADAVDHALDTLNTAIRKATEGGVQFSWTNAPTGIINAPGGPAGPTTIPLFAATMSLPLGKSAKPAA